MMKEDPKQIFYGRKVTNQLKGERAEFTNVAGEKTIVGEILLEKNPQDSICNICLKKKSLTKDHVPPKCTGNKGRFRYRSALNEILAADSPIRGICQNGIQFKTICEDCNQILCRFDVSIDELFTVARAHVQQNGFTPAKFIIKPNAIIRGFCGHFLSGKTSHIWSGLDEIFTTSLLELSSPVTSRLTCYVAPYCYDQIRVFRDLIFATAKGPVIVYFIKVYPLAFFFADGDLFNVPKWTAYFNVPIDEEAEVELFNFQNCPIDWPDNANYLNIPIGFGKSSAESILATPE